MIAFWMMTGLAAALAALLVLTGARRGADPAAGAETQAGSREIEELDRLKARGLLDGESDGPAVLRGPLASSRFFILQPAWIRLIDNTQGFGHKEELHL